MRPDHVLGMFITHLKPVYCKECGEVTLHSIKYCNIDPDDGEVLATAHCRNEISYLVKSRNWKKTKRHTVICDAYQRISLAVHVWNALISTQWEETDEEKY